MNRKKEQLVLEWNKLKKDSNLKEIQEYITKMMDANGFRNSSLELLCYLVEEIGELAKEIRKKEQNMEIDIKKDNHSSLKFEIADVFIYLLALCNTCNVDLFEALKEKEKINLDRMIV